MGVPAVEVQQVSKHFRLYHERHASVKDRLIHPGRSTYSDLVALKDVDAAIAGLNAGRNVRVTFRGGLAEHRPQRHAKPFEQCDEGFPNFPND